MGWLFYKSLDEQGEITASSSHLSHGPFQDERSSQQGGEGQVGKGRRSEEGIRVCCHSQGLLPAPQPGWLLVKRGVNSQRVGGKLSWSKRHLC